LCLVHRYNAEVLSGWPWQSLTVPRITGLIRRNGKQVQAAAREQQRLKAAVEVAEERAAQAEAGAAAAEAAEAERARLSRELTEVASERRETLARAQALESDLMDAARERDRLQREVRACQAMAAFFDSVLG
jgi:chromosome segregation ATPase